MSESPRPTEPREPVVSVPPRIPRMCGLRIAHRPLSVTELVGRIDKLVERVEELELRIIRLEGRLE